MIRRVLREFNVLDLLEVEQTLIRVLLIRLINTYGSDWNFRCFQYISVNGAIVYEFIFRWYLLPWIQLVIDHHAMIPVTVLTHIEAEWRIYASVI